MFEGEIIFYNGFNLLVDIVIGLTVWFFTRRSVGDFQYSRGIIETLEAIDSDELRWEIDPVDGHKIWLLPCSDGGVMRIDTMTKTYDQPKLFVVPEAD